MFVGYRSGGLYAAGLVLCFSEYKFETRYNPTHSQIASRILNVRSARKKIKLIFPNRRSQRDASLNLIERIIFIHGREGFKKNSV